MYVICWMTAHVQAITFAYICVLVHLCMCMWCDLLDDCTCAGFFNVKYVCVLVHQCMCMGVSVCLCFCVFVYACVCDVCMVCICV